jgi:hypothetical protein
MGAKVSFLKLTDSSLIIYSQFTFKKQIISNGNLSLVKTDISFIGLK